MVTWRIAPIHDTAIDRLRHTVALVAIKLPLLFFFQLVEAPVFFSLSRSVAASAYCLFFDFDEKVNVM